MTLGDASCCVAGAALGAPPARFAWQVQHLKHLRLVLRGRRSTWSTSGSFLRGRRSTWSISGSFCVAGPALEASQLRIAGQLFRVQTIYTAPSTQHQLHNIINTKPSPHHHLHSIINTTPSTHHHLHIIIYTASSTHHHLDSIINTAPSPQQHLTSHHLHNIVYTTSSTPHHLHNPHNTIYTTSSNIGRCSTWSTAILPLLPHSC